MPYDPYYYDPYYGQNYYSRPTHPQSYDIRDPRRNYALPPEREQNIKPEPERSAPTPVLVPVQSAEEAWKFPADWTGTKQFFIDTVNDSIYVKWFDANIPETFKEVYKKVPQIEKLQKDMENIPQDENNSLTQILESIKAVESGMTELRELLK